MRFEPQHPGRTGWINSALPPPSGFVAAAVDLTMMASAEGDGELVTDLAAECPALRKTQVMGIRRLAIANQTGLLGHIPDVAPVTDPARLRQGKYALIDRF